MGSYRTPEPWFPSPIRELGVCDTCTQGQRSKSSQPDAHLSGGPYIIANINKKINNTNTNRSINNQSSNLPKPRHVSIVRIVCSCACACISIWLAFLSPLRNNARMLLVEVRALHETLSSLPPKDMSSPPPLPASRE